MGQEKFVNNQAQTEVKIAGLKFPHTFLVTDISLPYILGNDLLTRASVVIDYNQSKLHLQWCGKQIVTQLQPTWCNDKKTREEAEENKVTINRAIVSTK